MNIITVTFIAKAYAIVAHDYHYHFVSSVQISHIANQRFMQDENVSCHDLGKV